MKLYSFVFLGLGLVRFRGNQNKVVHLYVLLGWVGLRMKLNLIVHPRFPWVN